MDKINAGRLARIPVWLLADLMIGSSYKGFCPERARYSCLHDPNKSQVVKKRQKDLESHWISECGQVTWPPKQVVFRVWTGDPASKTG